MNQGDERDDGGNKIAEAMAGILGRPWRSTPDNPEMIFWPAVTLASTGKVEESLPLFRKVFAVDPNWAELLRRLPAAGQFPKDETLMKRILAEVPKK